MPASGAVNVDLFLTGEPSEAAVHLAREEGIHFVAAGHHATERFGVQSLATAIAQDWNEQPWPELDDGDWLVNAKYGGATVEDVED